MSRLKNQLFPNILRSERRDFLKKSGILALLPFLPKAERLRLLDIFGGEAFASETQGIGNDEETIFIEVNLRDQWDFGHVFVPPGLARFPLLKRGDVGKQVALFDDQSQIFEAGNNFYLTRDALPLKPHLENIALSDTFELCIGAIHGHEGANALRSPGRTKTQKFGYSLMSNIDSGSLATNDIMYSQTPTPAIVHNFHSNALSKRNGIVLRGIGRSGVFAFHFDAGLNQGQLDRYYTSQALLDAYLPADSAVNFPVSDRQAVYLRNLMQRLDQRFSKDRPYSSEVTKSHARHLDRILDPQSLGNFSLPLTAEEEKYWLPDVPAQVSGEKKGLDIAHQFAYAFKLIKEGIVKTIAMEFDYADFHGDRNEAVMRTMSKQTAIPLARMIQALKDKGLFHRTLIAVYTTDGSRSPASNSVGDEGKNSMMLIGGMIKGGYYGDIKVAETFAEGHSFSYHMPDLVSGRPVFQGARDNTGRISGASGWKTVMKALKIPENFVKQYSDVNDHPVLDFMLRT